MCIYEIGKEAWLW